MVDSAIPFDFLGPGLEAPTTEIVTTAVGGFFSAAVTWTESVTNLAIPDVNIQAQKGTSTWHNCNGAVPGSGTTSILGFAGPNVNPTRIRITGTPVAVIPSTNPIGFPQEEPIPFP